MRRSNFVSYASSAVINGAVRVVRNSRWRSERKLETERWYGSGMEEYLNFEIYGTIELKRIENYYCRNRRRVEEFRGNKKKYSEVDVDNTVPSLYSRSRVCIIDAKHGHAGLRNRFTDRKRPTYVIAESGRC